MVAQVAGIDGDRLVVLLFLVLLATAARVEPVEQDPFPVDLVVGGLLLFLRRCLFRLDELEAWERGSPLEVTELARGGRLVVPRPSTA